MISARVVCDSIAAYSPRLTTLELTYPRFIHAEFMTHRVFSRNASSSRAIPVQKTIDRVKNDPVIPIYWGKNQPGMQADEELPPEAARLAEELWRGAAYNALDSAREMKEIGAHKQIINRLLEPWSTITVVVTATEWDNFFSLRCSSAAEPHMHQLADKMLDAMNASGPRFLEPGEWHLPYVVDMDTDFTEHLVKFSVARVARVSYLNHDGTTPDPKKDLELHDRLLSSGHMSPFEHQATVPTDFERGNCLDGGNLRDWMQYRKMLPNECRQHFEGLRIASVEEAKARRYK